MNEAQKPINLDCHTPLSEAFRIYMYKVFFDFVDEFTVTGSSLAARCI
jgi:hypothetical protein